MRFWIIVVVVVLAFAGGSALAFQQGWFQRAGPKYLTVKISRGRVETSVNSTGTVKPVKTVSVGAFVSGPIKEVKVDFTDAVTEGQVLAEIDPRLLQAAFDRDSAFLAVQEAELNRVEALWAQAKNNLERAKQLVKYGEAKGKDYLSQQEMDQFIAAELSLKAQRDLAKASIKQAVAAMQNSKTNLGFTKIISPVDGFILERKVDPGQTVVASFQTPELFSIAPQMGRRMHVYASVDEADIGMVQAAQSKGMKAVFTVDAYPDRFVGEILQIRSNSTTVQNVVTYPVIIEVNFPPPRFRMLREVKYSEIKLKPGMTATISFQIEAKENVLRIPAVALRYQPLPAQVRPEDKHYVEARITPLEPGARRSVKDKLTAEKKRNNRIVWVQEGRLLRAVPITLGLMESHFGEILEGELTEGQEVVTGVEGGR